RLLAVQRVEAALRHTHVERHLTAFETIDGDAAAGLLPLHAAPAGLALARADAAANAHQLLGRARIIGQFIQFHRTCSDGEAVSYFTTSTKWATLRIMPWIDGVSSSSTTWFARFRPRPSSVLR